MIVKMNPNFYSHLSFFKMEIYNSGYAELEKTWKCGDQVGALSRLYFIVEGSGEIISKSKTVPVKPGHVYFIPRGSTWDLKCFSEVHKFFIDFNLLTINGDLVFMEDASILERPFPVQNIRSLIDCYLSDHVEEAFYLKSVIYQCVADMLLAGNIRQPATVYSPLVLNTIKYIQKNLSLELSVTKLAEKAFVSKAYLSTQFKKEVGLSLGQYIDSQIIFRAKIELEQHKLSIAEISNKFGFCDQFYFSRFFKKHTGESPLQYRNNHRSLSFFSSVEGTKS